MHKYRKRYNNVKPSAPVNNDTEIYTRSRENFIRKNFLDKLVSHIPDIDSAIRKAGVLTRYFAHFISRPNNVVEINKDSFSKLSENAFYITTKIAWYVKGPKYSNIKLVLGKEVEYVGVEDSNKEAIKEGLLTMPSLSGYISDYLEFWQEE